jgi:hypothetical protein
VASYIQQSAGIGQLCPYASQKTWIDVGTATGAQPTTISDGAVQGGGKVSVACTVHPDGNGFDVQLNAGLSGQGSVTITSNAPGAVTQASGGKGITGTFESGQMGRYSSNNCTISYMYGNGKVPNNQPIAAGRIWAHLSCVDAQRTDTLMVGPDGGTTFTTCDTEADFIFENCAQ